MILSKDILETYKIQEKTDNNRTNGLSIIKNKKYNTVRTVATDGYTALFTKSVLIDNEEYPTTNDDDELSEINDEPIVLLDEVVKKAIKNTPSKCLIKRYDNTVAIGIDNSQTVIRTTDLQSMSDLKSELHTEEDLGKADYDKVLSLIPETDRKILINPELLIKILKQFKGEAVEIKFSQNRLAPLLIESKNPSEDQFKTIKTALVMPLKD